MRPYVCAVLHVYPWLTLETGGFEVTKKKFTELMYLKASRALADPGEPVGVIAAQAIGEPSTQVLLREDLFLCAAKFSWLLNKPTRR